MIKANIVTKEFCEVEIRGNWNDLMNEYKTITDYFLEHHFDMFMAAMDKWQADNKKWEADKK